MTTTPIHKLYEVNYENKTAVCSICGPTTIIWYADNYSNRRCIIAHEASNTRRRVVDSTSTLRHRLSQLNANEKTAICSICGPVKVYKHGARHWLCTNSPYIKEDMRRKSRAGVLRTESRNIAFTVGVCQNPGCSRPLEIRTGGYSIDHDHASGEIRGVLCSQCNLALGQLEDDPARIEGLLTYLRNPPWNSFEEKDRTN
jgi:ssDNA-binding Zn-finger/Zn-ribbon topoisomerase 1